MGKIFGLIFIAILAAAGWFAWASLAPVKPPAKIFVMLRPGYSTRRIASELKSAGIIRNEQVFILWRYIRHRHSLEAGEYLFEKPASTLYVQKRLQRGDVYFHTVIVPEGFTMFDIARAVEAAGLGPAEDFLKVARSDTTLIADLAPNAVSLEGYLFPDTYDFSRMQSTHELAAAMVKQFRQTAHQIGLAAAADTTPETSSESISTSSSSQSSNSPHTQVEENGRGRDLNAAPTNFQRTVILASIIEKETAVPEERAVVASVYYNRLAKKIALDADPSVIYAELLAGKYSGALHHDDMQFESRYNTYKYTGLPPGPIGNPGKSALEAAMHPAQSDYYYFVADAQGHHRFARTIEEHNNNVAAYRRAMRGQ